MHKQLLQTPGKIVTNWLLVAAKNLVVPVPIELAFYLTRMHLVIVRENGIGVRKGCTCKDIETEWDRLNTKQYMKHCEIRKILFSPFSPNTVKNVWI